MKPALPDGLIVVAKADCPILHFFITINHQHVLIVEIGTDCLFSDKNAFFLMLTCQFQMCE